MPIVNKQVKFLTTQYIGTCKSAYTKGYALNWVLTYWNIDGYIIYCKDMKCKFENSVNAILLFMFCLVLATISLSNCKGCYHDSNDNSNLEQIEKETINTDSVNN